MTPKRLLQGLFFFILIPVHSFALAAGTLPNPGPHLMDPQDRPYDNTVYPQSPQALPSELLVPNRPKTARTIKPFQSITPKMSMPDIVRLCGLPDEHNGSGVYIFVYHLSDGSSVTISTPDLKKIFYVNHELASGKTIPLLSSDKKTK